MDESTSWLEQRKKQEERQKRKEHRRKILAELAEAQHVVKKFPLQAGVFEPQNPEETSFVVRSRAAAQLLRGSSAWASQLMGLNLSPEFRDAKQRFLSLAKLWHPDSQGGSQEHMQELNLAWDIVLKSLEN